jgi:hypothetical protein
MAHCTQQQRLPSSHIILASAPHIFLTGQHHHHTVPRKVTRRVTVICAFTTAAATPFTNFSKHHHAHTTMLDPLHKCMQEAKSATHVRASCMALTKLRNTRQRHQHTPKAYTRVRGECHQGP